MSLLLLIVSSGKPELSHFWAVIPCGMWADCRWIMWARTEPELFRNWARTRPDRCFRNWAGTEPELGQTDVSRTGTELSQNWARPMSQNWSRTGPDQCFPKLGRNWARPILQNWAMSGPEPAHESATSGKPYLRHFWAVIPCGMWAAWKWNQWAIAGPDLFCYGGSFPPHVSCCVQITSLHATYTKILPEVPKGQNITIKLLW